MITIATWQFGHLFQSLQAHVHRAEDATVKDEDLVSSMQLRLQLAQQLAAAKTPAAAKGGNRSAAMKQARQDGELDSSQVYQPGWANRYSHVLLPPLLLLLLHRRRHALVLCFCLRTVSCLWVFLLLLLLSSYRVDFHVGVPPADG